MTFRPKRYPYEPADYDELVVMAVRALRTGTANQGQQDTVWQWLEYVCGVGSFQELSFRPGDDGDRDTVFAEGKRFVGLQLLKMLHPDTLEAVTREAGNERRITGGRGR